MTTDAVPPTRRPQRLWPVLQIVSVIVVAFVVTRLSLDLTAIREAARQGTLDALHSAGSPAPAVPLAARPTTVLSLTLRPANRLGAAAAPVTIVEFADFQCPFCGKFFTDVEAQLKQKYVETGQVAFVYKHLAILGDESIWAAEAAECAADQDQFWAYHAYLFAHQAGENQGAFTKEKLMAFAQELNLDMTQFGPCLQTDRTAERVQTDTREGGAAGASGTPTFFINGQPLVGAQPLAAFESAIQQAAPVPAKQ
jgi:protein-disulfide isomerase